MKDPERKQAFIKQLAIYLVGDQAHKSIELQMRKESAQQWADLRGKTPLFGYPTVEEAEQILTEFLDLGENEMIEHETMMEFIGEIGALRIMFPELAKELDKCLFDVMNNHTPKCGHGTCSCQTMTFERFHAERNLKFDATKEERIYESVS